MKLIINIIYLFFKKYKILTKKNTMNSKKSLYIQIENQQLLWEMLHKTPQLSHFFSQNDPSSQNKKEIWFRNIIADFHNKTPIVQSREQLLAINRQTLSFMMNQLTAFIETQKQPPTQILQPIHQPVNEIKYQTNIDPVGTTYSRNFRDENREETYKRQFEEREREYKSMVAQPELPKVNFALSEDTAISNMAELVEQHRRLRELDIQPIASPPSQQPLIETGSQNLKLKLQEDLPTEIIRMDAISLEPMISVGKRENIKRQVTWNDHIELDDNSNILLLKKEIDELKVDMKELKDVIFEFIGKKSGLEKEKREPTEIIDSIEIKEKMKNIDII